MDRKAEAIRRNLEKTVEELFAECQERFDWGLAAKICRERKFPQCDLIKRDETLRSFIALFKCEHTQVEILAVYIEELKERICGTAQCGCWYSVENGVPCKHDWAMLDKPITIQ